MCTAAFIHAYARIPFEEANLYLPRKICPELYLEFPANGLCCIWLIQRYESAISRRSVAQNGEATQKYSKHVEIL